MPGLLSHEDPGPHSDAHHGQGTLRAGWDELIGKTFFYVVWCGKTEACFYYVYVGFAKNFHICATLTDVGFFYGYKKFQHEVKQLFV